MEAVKIIRKRSTRDSAPSACEGLAGGRCAARSAENILKGVKPADLTLGQRRRFERVINLRTADALCLTVLQSVLIRAAQAIQ